MPDFTLTEKQFNDLKHILTVDNANLADHPEFFDESGLDPKEFIPERIALCNALKIDYWDTVIAFSPSYNLQRLQALFNGQSIKSLRNNTKDLLHPGLQNKWYNSLKIKKRVLKIKRKSTPLNRYQ